jgi:hypothetical protein
MSKVFGVAAALLAGAEGTTKSGKFASAVARATGQEMTVRSDEIQTLVVLPSKEEIQAKIPVGFGDLMTPFDNNELMLELAKGEMEWAPAVLPLVEGTIIGGILEGRGGAVEMDEIDPVTKRVITKHVGTWVVRHPRTGLRASFLTAAQLEEKLPPFVGGPVKIYVGGMLESKKGRRYRDFRVGGPKLPNGETRTFARKPTSTVIDVPAGGPEDAEDLGVANPAA